MYLSILKGIREREKETGKEKMELKPERKKAGIWRLVAERF